MKKIFSVISILLILGFFCINYSQITKRTAVIVDQGGTSTELKRVIFRQVPRNYTHTQVFSGIAIITGPIVVLIKGQNILSIENTGGETKNKRIFDVSYYWMGEKKMISGILVKTSFSGKSDFGNINLSSEKLKTLRFSQVSDKITQKEEFHPVGYIILRDGTKFEFKNLKRHNRYAQPFKKLVKEDAIRRYYETVYKEADEYSFFIPFYRGESNVEVAFRDLKSIEFEDQGVKNILVTLQNGNSTKGKLRDPGSAGTKGFNGVFEKGEFYVEIKNIKTVHLY
jgi:hypothetical protein